MAAPGPMTLPINVLDSRRPPGEYLRCAGSHALPLAVIFTLSPVYRAQVTR